MSGCVIEELTINNSRDSETPVQQYLNAMAAVQKPSLAPDAVLQDFSYVQSNKDASAL